MYRYHHMPFLFQWFLSGSQTFLFGLKEKVNREEARSALCPVKQVKLKTSPQIKNTEGKKLAVLLLSSIFILQSFLFFVFFFFSILLSVKKKKKKKYMEVGKQDMACSVHCFLQEAPGHSTSSPISQILVDHLTMCKRKCQLLQDFK